ncbi:MAG TPA: thioredoxin [Candidatus Acidoferrum sp.]|nr:thioredoxin [Candidatus Acidoferrum sp.]
MTTVERGRQKRGTVWNGVAGMPATEENTNKENQTGGLTMSVLTITKDNFQKEVMESDRPVLLDFWAAWCGPCRMVSPLVDEIAQETPAVKVGKVNIDEQRELAASFNVMSIPTLVVVKDGQVVNKAVGARPKGQIVSLLG